MAHSFIGKVHLITLSHKQGKQIILSQGELFVKFDGRVICEI